VAANCTGAKDMSDAASSGQMVRALDWRGAFWVAAGVPPLVLFSIGGIAGTTGKLAFMVWIISMIMGFLQSFTYAEMAGMFGNKSGGTSVYGATAIVRLVQLVCLVAGIVIGVCHCGRVYSECSFPDTAGYKPTSIGLGQCQYC
jgi:amino acid transporter